MKNNKNQLLTSVLCAAVLSVGLASSAGAALFARGAGMVYDDDLNITWLQDANYSQTSGYDDDGLMNWHEALAWADQLEFAGNSNWRLPAGGNCPQYDCTYQEMGHLFYVELDGVAHESISTTLDSDLALF